MALENKVLVLDIRGNRVSKTSFLLVIVSFYNSNDNMLAFVLIILEQQTCSTSIGNLVIRKKLSNLIKK